MVSGRTEEVSGLLDSLPKLDELVCDVAVSFGEAYLIGCWWVEVFGAVDRAWRTRKGLVMVVWHVACNGEW